MQNQADLPGMHMTPCMLAKLYDPGGNHQSLALRSLMLLPATELRVSASTYDVTRLNHFTFVMALMLSVLRLMLASRLCIQGLDTDCWLGYGFASKD